MLPCMLILAKLTLACKVASQVEEHFHPVTSYVLVSSVSRCLAGPEEARFECQVGSYSGLVETK